MYRNIDICYTGYITIKNIGDYEIIHSVNPLYFITGDIIGGILLYGQTEEKNGNKYLVSASTDKIKKVLEKYI